MRKPKMPKANASLNTWNNYKKKLQEFKQKKKVIDEAKKLRSQV